MGLLRKKESQILAYAWGAVLILILINIVSCRNPFSSDLPDTATLSASPVEPADCGWIGPYGTLYEMGSTRFHNGIDFNTVSGGRFLACADGEVKKIELNTGAGLPGTNYRITITVAKNLELDYHFEIGGSVSEAEREKNILVTKGKRVKAGQHIANLIVVDSDIAHVHFCVLEKGNVTKCPLDYFSKDIANLLEQLYDAKPRVYSHSLNPNLCN